MRFSVIIPLYNKAHYVQKALESVVAQTFQGFELIVVDDGSNDASYKTAKGFLSRSHVNYQLIHQENAGVSSARNNGVSVSHGDYLCFLDADDWWDPAFLEEMDRFIQCYPEAGIYGTNYYYVKNGQQRVCVTNAETGYINYCQVYSKGKSMPLTSISISISRSVFKEFYGFKSNLKLGEDFDLWIRIALKYKVAFLNKPLAYYNQDSSTTGRGTHQLHEPQHHMLWNLEYLSEEEINNPDYKLLIDSLRTYSLLPYYMSAQYHDAAKQELSKVDWSKQPPRIRHLYKQPVFLLKSRESFLKFGSRVKQWLIKHL